LPKSPEFRADEKGYVKFTERESRSELSPSPRRPPRASNNHSQQQIVGPLRELNDGSVLSREQVMGNKIIILDSSSMNDTSQPGFNKPMSMASFKSEPITGMGGYSMSSNNVYQNGI